MRQIAFAMMLVAIGSLVPAAWAQDWPQFRGPTGQGISTAKDVPVKWSATSNVAWKTAIPGKGWSSPVVADGKVYLTTAGGGPVGLYAVCLDAATGKILWNTEVFQPDPKAARTMHQKNSPASATPVVTADRLYVHFGHLGTAALDLTGKVLWTQQTLKYSPVHGNGCSPVLVDKELVFSCDGQSDPFLVALDAGTGKINWKTPRNTTVRKTFSFCTPLVIEVDGSREIISPCSGLVGGYDPADGHEMWRVRYGEGYSVVPRPIYSHGLLFLSSGFDLAVLYAINPAGAKGDATRSAVAWTSNKGAPHTPSVVASGDEIYFISDKGLATCADQKTGKVYWEHNFTGGFSSSPVLAEGRVYFQNETGTGYVIKASTTFEQLAENPLDERSLASYAVTDGALFIRTEGDLFRVK